MSKLRPLGVFASSRSKNELAPGSRKTAGTAAYCPARRGGLPPPAQGSELGPALPPPPRRRAANLQRNDATTQRRNKREAALNLPKPMDAPACPARNEVSPLRGIVASLRSKIEFAPRPEKPLEPPPIGGNQTPPVFPFCTTSARRCQTKLPAPANPIFRRDPSRNSAPEAKCYLNSQTLFFCGRKFFGGERGAFCLLAILTYPGREPLLNFVAMRRKELPIVLGGGVVPSGTAIVAHGKRECYSLRHPSRHQRYQHCGNVDIALGSFA